MLKNKRNRVEIRLGKVILDKLNAICRVEKMTKSDCIRSLIEKKFDESLKYKDELYGNMMSNNFRER